MHYIHKNKCVEYVCRIYNIQYIYSVPTNRHESTNTNRNEPRGHWTGKWKRTAGTEPKFCGNRTENHSYIWIWYVKLFPSFPSFPGLRITSTAEQLWPRNISILMERLSKYCNSQYPCSILNSTIPQPPWRHFWEQTLLSGGCGIVRLSILHGFWGLQYLLNLSITTENFEAKVVRQYSLSATPGKQSLPPKVSPGGLRDRTVEYATWVKGITVFAQSFHCNREFRRQSCSAILIFRTFPSRQFWRPMLLSESYEHQRI